MVLIVSLIFFAQVFELIVIAFGISLCVKVSLKEFHALLGALLSRFVSSIKCVTILWYVESF